MTDREPLERAAKAAGMVGYEPCECCDALVKIEPGKAPIYWNPRDDDGDAFRLAVAMRQMVVRIDIASTAAFRNDVHGMPAIFAGEPHGTDPCAATRLAILRAAASMAQPEGAV